MNMGTITGLEKGVQSTLKRIYISLSEAHVHVHTHRNTDIHTNPVKLIFNIFTLSSCLVQTPYSLNWILAHCQVQCLRVPYL